MASPKEISVQLKRIAAAIDNSKKPSASLVATELKKVVAAISKDELVSTAKQVFDVIKKSPDFSDVSIGDETGNETTIEYKIDGEDQYLTIEYNERDGISAAVFNYGTDDSIHELSEVELKKLMAGDTGLLVNL